MDPRCASFCRASGSSTSPARSGWTRPQRAQAGFLIWLINLDHPETTYVHIIAANPNRRRDGIGRELYEHFFEDAAATADGQVTAITWPGNRVSVASHGRIECRAKTAPAARASRGSRLLGS